jgi:ion channel-forming bestrophin family protein
MDAFIPVLPRPTPLARHRQRLRYASAATSCMAPGRGDRPGRVPTPPTWTQRRADFVRDLLDTSGTQRFASPDPRVVQSAWTRHRSRRRYARHWLGFPMSKLGRRLAPLPAVTLLESLGLYCYEHVTGAVPQFSGAPIAYMSGVVGLLLAFRTNASLARYYEARGSWAAVMARSCDISRIGLEYIDSRTTASPLAGPSHSKEARAHQLVRYVATYCHVLRSHLEGAEVGTVRERVEHLVAGEELSLVLDALNRPNTVLQLISHATGASLDDSMDHHMRYKLDAGLTGLGDAANTLEKLLRTPIPLSYTRHTSRACLLWCGRSCRRRRAVHCLAAAC